MREQDEVLCPDPRRRDTGPIARIGRANELQTRLACEALEERESVRSHALRVVGMDGPESGLVGVVLDEIEIRLSERVGSLLTGTEVVE